jgi:hypothetical protein
MPFGAELHKISNAIYLSGSAYAIFWEYHFDFAVLLLFLYCLFNSYIFLLVFTTFGRLILLKS